MLIKVTKHQSLEELNPDCERIFGFDTDEEEQVKCYALFIDIDSPFAYMQDSEKVGAIAEYLDLDSGDVETYIERLKSSPFADKYREMQPDAIKVLYHAQRQYIFRCADELRSEGAGIDPKMEEIVEKRRLDIAKNSEDLVKNLLFLKSKCEKKANEEDEEPTTNSATIAPKDPLSRKFGIK